jgi:hypothetical protein
MCIDFFWLHARLSIATDKSAESYYVDHSKMPNTLFVFFGTTIRLYIPQNTQTLAVFERDFKVLTACIKKARL